MSGQRLYRDAMPNPERRHLYLPARDRSFWKADASLDVPLLYLAWGSRDFSRQPIPASRHDGWVTVLIEEGSPTLVARHEEVPMPAGTLAVIGPDCPFGWTGADDGPSRFLLWMWRSSTGDAPETDAAAIRITRLRRRADRRPFAALHDLCRREVLRPGGPGAAYLEGCRILFEATLEREMLATRSGGGLGAPAGELARAWFEAHLDSREPVARLCDYLNVSQSTLYRLFVAETGMSPLSWFQQARMRKAHELIVERGQSVKEAAHALGYEHPNDLSRAYRRRFGHSPRHPRNP